MPKYETWPYLEIEGEPVDKGNYIEVIVKSTGKPANLPLTEIQQWGGNIFVKKWLYDRICPQGALN